MSYTWRKGGQSLGGYCNAMAAGAGVAIACGDVWGFGMTRDYGTSWYPTNLGQTPGKPYGRCAAFSQKHPGRAYVGVGTLRYKNGSGGGYLGMIDEAETGSPFALERANTDVSFTSYLPSGGAGDLPRPAGRLIAVDYDEASGVEYVYLATRQGVFRSTDGGQTLYDFGLKPPGPLYAWSAICALPNKGHSLYVASFRTSDTGGSRVWRIDDARTDSPTVREITGLPPVVEDVVSIRIDGANRFAFVCGPYGVVTPAGRVYAPADSKLHLSSIVQGADGTLWLGNGIGADDHRCIARSRDGGASWQWVTPSAACKDTLAGTDRSWWLADAWSTLGKGSGYSVSQLAVDAANPSVVYSAGRAGVWQTRDGGNTWHPCGDGLDGSESGTHDHTDVGFVFQDGEVWAADQDYKSSHSTDGFVNADRDTNPPAWPAAKLSRTAAETGGPALAVTGTRILVDGVDQADDYARSSLVGPKDVGMDAAGRIYVAVQGGVLVGDPA